MKEIDANRKNWDSRVPIHLKSKVIYNLEKFMQGENSFGAEEDKELSEFVDVKGKDILHLQCHFGLDSMSFARLGARVTGVDFSHRAITEARRISGELGIDCDFIESNVLDLDIKREFDIVFTSVGVLPWLSDLKSWARVIHKHLSKGGIFYLKDTHPIMYTIDEEAKSPEDLKLRHRYFNDGRSIEFNEPWTYAHDGTDEHLEHKVHYEWQHSISEVLNSLISAGLKIIHMNESPFGFFRLFDFMSLDQDGRWVLPDQYRYSFPLTFTLIAVKE